MAKNKKNSFMWGYLNFYKKARKRFGAGMESDLPLRSMALSNTASAGALDLGMDEAAAGD